MRGHRGVDLISLEGRKQTSPLVLPGTQLWPRCPQQPFPQGGTLSIPRSSCQPSSQRQGRKAGGLQCPFPTQLLGGGRSVVLSFLLWVTWFNLRSNSSPLRTGYVQVPGKEGGLVTFIAHKRARSLFLAQCLGPEKRIRLFPPSCLRFGAAPSAGH